MHEDLTYVLFIPMIFCCCRNAAPHCCTLRFCWLNLVQQVDTRVAMDKRRHADGSVVVETVPVVTRRQSDKNLSTNWCFRSGAFLKLSIDAESLTKRQTFFKTKISDIFHRYQQAQSISDWHLVCRFFGIITRRFEVNNLWVVELHTYFDNQASLLHVITAKPLQFYKKFQHEEKQTRKFDAQSNLPA